MMQILPTQIKDSVLGQLIALKEKIDYYNKSVLPFMETMENWERNEYKTLYAGAVSEMEVKKQYVMENEAVFNELLSSSKINMSVAVFINKYVM